jgi:hypothetical protein
LKALSLVLWFFTVGAIHAQPVFSPRLQAMGGVGTAISSSVDAAFSNPANLMIRNHKQGFLMHVGHGSFQSTNEIADRHAIHPFQIWTNESEHPLTADATGYASFDQLLAGFSYTGPNFAMSLGWRVRGENTWSAGNGWFDTSGDIVDRSLSQKVFIRQEVALGFAWEYELISGWLTDLSKLYVGVNPKVVLPGMFAEQSLTSLYGRIPDGTMTHVGSYELLAAGPMGAYAASGGITPLLTEDLLTPTGIGGGLDMGFTYIIGVGNEQSLGYRRRDQTKNSIRVSASMTDIGIVSLTQSPVRRTSESRSNINPLLSAPWTQGFTGSPGHMEAILSEADTERVVRDRANEGKDGHINLALPTTVHAGGAIQLNRFLVTSDLRIPLYTHPYYADSRSLRFGSELKLLRLLPLRGGVIFREGFETTYTAGFGLDFRNLDISFSGSFRMSDTGSVIPVGLGAAALQLRL